MGTHTGPDMFPRVWELWNCSEGSSPLQAQKDEADPAVAVSTVHFTLGGALLGEVEAKSNISSFSFYNVKVFELLNHLPAFKTNSFKHKELASHFLKMRV